MSPNFETGTAVMTSLPFLVGNNMWLGLQVSQRGKLNIATEFVFCVVHAKYLIIQIAGPPTASLPHQLLNFHRTATTVSQPPRSKLSPNKRLVADRLAAVF
jgi:hypothetical protein